MEIFSSNLLLLNSITRNSELLKWFKQMVFLIHRNTYGGASKHDLGALYEIKINLARVLDDPEREYITKLIDSLSLYDLPHIMSGSMNNKLLERDVFKYISGQKPSDLCDILIEHLPKNNGLLLSIEVNEQALSLVNELADFALDNPPDKMAELNMIPCNVWKIIKDAETLPDNHIHIAFVTHDNEDANFLYYKGLCMALQYLEDIAEKPVEKKVREREKKAFMPNFGHGIASLARKITGGELNSNVMISKDVPLDQPAKKKGIKRLFKGKSKSTAVSLVKEEDFEQEVITPTLDVINDYESEDENTTNYKGRGFYDMEQGFLFNIT